MIRFRFHAILSAIFGLALTSLASAQVVRFEPQLCTPQPAEVTAVVAIRIVGIDPARASRNLPVMIDTNRPSPAQVQVFLQDGSVRTSQVNASVMELIGPNRFEIRYHFDFPPTPGMGLQSSIVVGPNNDPVFPLAGSFSTWRRGATPPRPLMIRCYDLPVPPVPGPLPGPGMGGHN